MVDKALPCCLNLRSLSLVDGESDHVGFVKYLQSASLKTLSLRLPKRPALQALFSPNPPTEHLILDGIEEIDKDVLIPYPNNLDDTLNNLTLYIFFLRILFPTRMMRLTMISKLVLERSM